MSRSRAPVIAGLGLAALALLGVGVGAVIALAGPVRAISPLSRALAEHHGITPALAQGIVDTAQSVGTKPAWLAALIDLETGGTFRPDIEGPPPGRPVGLIQFTEKTSKWLGTSKAKLSQMSASEQLAYVRAYLQATANGEHYDDPRPMPLDTLQRLAYSVFWPPGRDKPLSSELPEPLRPGNAVVKLSDYTVAVQRRMYQGEAA